MLPLKLTGEDSQPLRVLCLGAHPDDLEIGCGGTILKLAGKSAPLEVRWVVFSGDELRAREARQGAEYFLARADLKEIELLQFRDGFFPYEGGRIKEWFEQLKKQFQPDLIFTHYRYDLHQDHRLLCELTWNTFRDHLILEYEIPKYDGDMGSPNLFVSLDESLLARKIEYLLKAYTSQQDRHWFCEDTFRALSRLRGLESVQQGGYAEAFYGRKAVILF